MTTIWSGHFFFFAQKRCLWRLCIKWLVLVLQYTESRESSSFRNLNVARWCTCRRALFLMTLLVKNGFKLFKSTLFSAVLAKSMSPEAARARAQLLSGSPGRQGSMEAPKQVQMVPGGASVEPLRKICRRSRRFHKIFVDDIGPYSSL